VTQSTDRANAWTVALKWIPTAYTAYMANVVHTKFGGPVIANGRTLDEERAIEMRAQFDFF
jgi:phosphate-selective porin